MTDGQATVFMHVEVVHPDPDGVAAFMAETMGAVQVEKMMSAQVEKLAEGLRVVHVQAGGVVFQLIKPVLAPGIESWFNHLSEHGPSVHNVTLAMNGLESVRQKMIERGGSVVAQFDMDVSDVGLGLTGTRRTYVIDAIPQTGMRFEMFEHIAEWVPGEAP